MDYDSVACGTLAGALERATHVGERAAVVYVGRDGRERSESYAELHARARKILGGLARAGVGPRAHVLLQLDDNDDFIPAFWACVLGDLIPVPIGVPATFDASSPIIGNLRLASTLLDRPVVVAGHRAHAPLRSLLEQHAVPLQVLHIEDLRTAPPAAHVHAAEAKDIALLLLTSGSSGVSKYVPLTHENILSRSAGAIQVDGLTPQDVSLNWMALVHAGGLVMFHLRDVCLGCKQLHVHPDFILEDPLRWLELLERHRVTVTHAANFAYALVNARAADLEHRHFDLSSVRITVNGSEAIVARTARQFLRLLEAHGLSKHAMHPAWGMTETSSAVTLSDRFTLESTSDDDDFVEVGRALPGVELRVVDQNGKPVGDGTRGSLLVRGAAVTSGYFRNPEVNAEAFTADGWLKTGDLALVADGVLTITGREKELLIVNGVNFAPHEIETVVDEVDGVMPSYTAAFAVRGEGNQTDDCAILFCAESDDQVVPLVKEIRARVVRALGINPLFVVPILPAQIPKTVTGKIQRSQLRKRFEEGAFAREVMALAQRSLLDNARLVPPATDIEQGVARIWSEVLGLRIDLIGATSNLFDLGGNSLHMAALVGALRAAYGVEMPLSRLFEPITVREMAQMMETKPGAPATAIAREPLRPRSRDASASAPLSSLQEPFWILAEMEQVNAATQPPFALRIEGDLNLDLLKLTLSTIVARQTTLRSIFSNTVNGPIQRVEPPRPPDEWFAVRDLRQGGEGGADIEARLWSRVAAEARIPIDLRQGPAFRFVLFLLRDAESVLVWLPSHLVADVWSSQILMRELSVIYGALATGSGVELHDLPIQYADYACWERTWRHGPLLDAQRSYWREKLNGPVPELPFPTATATQCPTWERTGLIGNARLSPELLAKIERVSSHERTTMFTILLSAYKIWMEQQTGQKDLWVGVSTSNRSVAETRDLVGQFVSMVIVRTKLAGKTKPLETLRQVRAETLSALDHGDLRYHEILALPQLRRARDRMSHLPVFNFNDAWPSEFEAGGIRYRALLDTYDVMNAAEDRMGDYLVAAPQRDGCSLKMFPSQLWARVFPDATHVLRSYVEALDEFVQALVLETT